MSQVEKMIKDSTIYTISIVVSQLIGMLTSIAMRRFLTPEMMGVWTTFLVVLNYCLFAHLGVFTAIEVKIPYLRGKNENAELQNMRNVAFTFAIVLSVILSIAALTASIILACRLPVEIIFGIRVLALIVPATLFYNLYIVMLRADKGFLLISKATIFNSVAMLISVSALTYFFKLKGIYFATLLATSVSWFYMYFKTKYNLKLNFNIRLIKVLADVGLPILLGGVVYTVLLSIDKIMIMKYLGPAALGYYSIAMLAMTYTHNFPRLFGIVILPTMQEEFGKSDSRKHILEYVKQPSFILAYLFPIVLAAAYFGIPILVHYLLPKYIPGIDSMKILLFGCFFISLVPLTHNFVVAINKQMVLIPLTLAAVIAGIGVNYLAIKMGYGIAGVALGTSIAYFIYFAMMFFFALIHCDKLASVIKSFLKICLPLFYALIIIVGLEYLVRIGHVMIRAAVQALIFSVVYIPMLWYLDRKTGVILKILRRKRAVLPEAEVFFTEIPGER